ncbi:MAG: phosphate signaling complex protein PhoU [Bacteroidota bacterium]|jgi:phosphate transport system protein
MSHLNIELQDLRSNILEMFELVQTQLTKSKESFLQLDKDLAREVVINEKRVNGFELKIDRDCENIIALFNPVAIDLRFVLACMKINSNLERIGDIAESVAKFVMNFKLEPEKELLETSRVIEMFDTCIEIMNTTARSFAEEDTKLARSIFKLDETVDEINIEANDKIAAFIRTHADRINQSLYTISMIRKLERVGDQCKNIAEETIFYIEAKVLKHKNKQV